MKWIAFKDELPPVDRTVIGKVHPVGIYTILMFTEDDEGGLVLIKNPGEIYEEEVLYGEPDSFTHWALIEG